MGKRISDADTVSTADDIVVLSDGSLARMPSDVFTALISDDVSGGLESRFTAIEDDVSAINADNATQTELDVQIARIDALTTINSGRDLQGTWDASGGTFPVSTTTGEFWIVNTAGTVDGVAFAVNDEITALVDGASTTTYAGNWYKTDVSLQTEDTALTGTPTAPTASVSTNTTQLATTAFSQALDAETRGVDVPFITKPAGGSELLRIKQLELYSSVNGVSVDLPSQVAVREMGRDLTSTGRFRLRIAEFDGASTYTDLLRERGTGFYILGPQSGETWVTLEASSTELGFPIGTELGRALVDFGSDDAFGTYAGTIAHSVSGVYPDQLQRGSAFDHDVQEVVNDTVALSENYRLPFADECTASDIRRVIRFIRLYNADKAKTYAVSVFTVETYATPLTRFRATIRNITDGVDVCAVSVSVASQPTFADFVATLEDTVKLTSFSLGADTGVYAVVHLDWSAVSDFFSYGASTVAGAGLSPEIVYDDGDIADYLQSDHVHETITVGASGADYTTLRAAVESTYSWVTGSALVGGTPLCDRSCYHHRIAFRLIDDGDYNATGLYLPEWCEIVGNGFERTRIVRENTDADPIIEGHLSCKARDLTIHSQTAGEYCWHSDDVNRNADGGAAQNRFIRQSFKRLRMTGATGHDGWLFGCGISAGQDILFEDVNGGHDDATATAPLFGIHNSGPTDSTPGITVGVKPSTVMMRGCSSHNQLGVYIQTLEPAGICTLSLIDCDFNRIDHNVATGEVAGSGADRIQWDILGRYDGPWMNIDAAADSYTLEWLPSAIPRRKVSNATGSAIPKGRFVRFTGAATVALCGAGERPEAWTIAEIADGSTGDVVLTKRVTDDYIDAATTTVGSLVISNAGSGGTDGTFALAFSGGGGSGAAGTFTVASGSVSSVSVTNAGSGYTSMPSVDLSASSGLTDASVVAYALGDWGITTAGTLDYAASPKLGRTVGGTVIIY